MNHAQDLIKEVIGFIVGLVIFVFGIRASQKRQRLIRAGKRARGVIAELVQDKEADNSSVYYPVIEFQTVDKVSIRKKYPIGSGYGTYTEGHSVIVIYPKNDPNNFVIDSLPLQLTGVLLTVVGIVIMVLAVSFIVFFLMI